MNVRMVCSGISLGALALMVFLGWINNSPELVTKIYATTALALGVVGHFSGDSNR